MVEFINPLSFAGASQPRLEAITPGEKAVADLRRGLSQIKLQGGEQRKTQQVADAGAYERALIPHGLRSGPELHSGLTDIKRRIGAESGAKILGDLGPVGIFSAAPEGTSLADIGRPSAPTRRGTPTATSAAAATGQNAAQFGREVQDKTTKVTFEVDENGVGTQVTTVHGVKDTAKGKGPRAPEDVQAMIDRALQSPRFKDKKITVESDPSASSGLVIIIEGEPTRWHLKAP